jgi:hypothetical protein
VGGGFRRGGGESAAPAHLPRLGGGDEGARGAGRQRCMARPWLEVGDWGQPEVEDGPDGWVPSVSV